MASPARYCSSCLLSITSPSALTRARPTIINSSPVTSFQAQVRHATQSLNALKYRRKEVSAAKKKKAKTTFDEPDLRDMQQFSLVDAMRYLRAAEVGREPASMKYELALRLKTAKNGAVLRNRLRLPHPVRTNLRVAVFCEPNSDVAAAALRAGASVVGDDALFEDIKAGKIDFERAICHVGTTSKLNKSGVAKVLGPRGMMPSARMGTVATDVAAALRNMHGGTEFRERTGAVRVAIGQLGYSPDQLSDNIKALLALIKKDMGALSDRTPKEIHEIVLSSTNGPGFSLNGDFGDPKLLESVN